MIRAFQRSLHPLYAVMLALCAVAPLGALAQTVNVEFDDSVNFAKFKTFTVKEGRITSRAPALSSDLTRKRLQTEIEKALVAKGLTLSSEPTDLYVTFQFGSERNFETKTYPAGWRGLNTRVVNVRQSEGTLAIDINDSATKTLVWRGTAMEGEPNPIKLAERLDKMVKKAIAKYPPKKSK